MQSNSLLKEVMVLVVFTKRLSAGERFSLLFPYGDLLQRVSQKTQTGYPAELQSPPPLPPCTKDPYVVPCKFIGFCSKYHITVVAVIKRIPNAKSNHNFMNTVSSPCSEKTISIHFPKSGSADHALVFRYFFIYNIKHHKTS